MTFMEVLDGTIVNVALPTMQVELGDWGMQFSHTLDEQVRGQIQAGFRLLDLFEDTNGTGLLHELGIPTF